MHMQRIVGALSGVKGVSAIALGGSRSRGETRPDSDYDIGVYYRADGLEIAALSAAMAALDDEHRSDVCNPPGVWGPWVNGGGWLRVDGMAVDVLLRDVARVEAVLDDCVSGNIRIDYQCGHPFGFVNAIYAAETHFAKPLWQDQSKPLDRLKGVLYAEGDYPPRMKTAMIDRFTWEAGFSIACARKSAPRGDVNHAIGSAFISACAWAEAIYALNGEYMMNEKGALDAVERMPRRPEAMKQRIESAYLLIARGDAGEALAMLDALHADVQSLTADSHTP